MASVLGLLLFLRQQLAGFLFIAVELQPAKHKPL